MTTKKEYGYCTKCRQKIISVIRDDKLSSKRTLYYCPYCDAERTFNFGASKKLEPVVEQIKNIILENEK